MGIRSPRWAATEAAYLGTANAQAQDTRIGEHSDPFPGYSSVDFLTGNHIIRSQEANVQAFCKLQLEQAVLA